MDYLTYFPMWDQLKPEQQHVLEQAAHVRHIAKGEIIHNGSLDCTGLYLVTSGQLRAYALSEDGREITMYRLFHGDICLFSASCIMSSVPLEIIIASEKETDAVIIPSDVFKSVLDVSAPLANYTRELMTQRFSDVMWLIEQVMWKSIDKRLAEFLLNEASIEGTEVLKITHETIGNHLGSPREVVTRMLRYFSNEGLISLSRGTIQIVNSKNLQKVMEG